MSACAAVEHWGSTPGERSRQYPCDDVLPDHEHALFRAVTIEAPPSVVYRWLCQIKLAPYSYDLLDNLGRRSPQHLVPGVENLSVGERVLIFRLESFVIDEHFTIALRNHRLFGELAISYVVEPIGADSTRLIVKLATTPPRGPVGAFLRRVLPAGDLVMMRRQLLNFKALAEATALDVASVGSRSSG